MSRTNLHSQQVPVKIFSQNVPLIQSPSVRVVCGNSNQTILGYNRSINLPLYTSFHLMNIQAYLDNREASSRGSIGSNFRRLLFPPKMWFNVETICSFFCSAPLNKSNNPPFIGKIEHKQEYESIVLLFFLLTNIQKFYQKIIKNKLYEGGGSLNIAKMSSQPSKIYKICSSNITEYRLCFRIIPEYTGYAPVSFRMIQEHILEFLDYKDMLQY